MGRWSRHLSVAGNRTARRPVLLVAAVLAGWGAQADAGGRLFMPADDGEDVDPLAFFTENIAAQIVQARCVNCHVAGGPAASTPLRFAHGDGAEATQGNYQALVVYVGQDATRTERMLAKVQGRLGHGGGVQWAQDSADFRNLETFLGLLQEEDDGNESERVAAAGYGPPAFLSPHANPIAVNGGFVYVVNTPAGTVDVISVANPRIVARINVGVDPVGVAVRPDGKEVWVANHVSDTVSVIDTDAGSLAYRQVVATIQDVDPGTLSTRFDEPVGIAFASNDKAYVALSPSNRIAIVDVATRTVSGHLRITAQDPRAIAVRGNRLYVVPFESNNRTQLSGCVREKIDNDTCTFDAVEHVFSNNNVLSANYDADIVKNPLLPDRDLYVFDTETDRLVEIVEGVGTLLYGLAIDSQGKVFVTQTDARNDANGKAGTRKHGLEEMENRAFLNQITMIDCGGYCKPPVFFDLEPLPPAHPAPGMALATPFGIQASADDRTLVVTAASSDKLFTVDAGTGTVLGRVDVGAAPRGVAVESNEQGGAIRGWVLNAVSNTVSVVALSDRANPQVDSTIELEDPTHPDVKLGRMAFNDADASSTGTFSCESCHPDGHTDQLIWVLATPECDVDGCTQIPPRLTMPVRGLRDTQPYHWDGIPGDPYGGNNTSSINAPVEPNCSIGDPEGCIRFLIDGSMATTMCDQTNCPTNDEGKSGLLDAEQRDAMAKFLLGIPYPPSQTRPFHNAMTSQARDGFFQFNFVKDCGNCHKMPFLVSSNTPGTGMDAPTWRGAYERWMVTPQARLNIIDLMNIVRMDDSFPERDMWILAGANPGIWEMVLQGSTGFPGAFGRQATLSAATARLLQTRQILDSLMLAASEGAIRLQADGIRIAAGVAVPLALALEYQDGRFVARDGAGVDSFSREALVDEAAAGELILTLTGRLGAEANHPQPALWQDVPIHQQTPNVEAPFLASDGTLRMKGRHVQPGAGVFVDGRKVEGSVRCESGTLPVCDDEIVLIELAELPAAGGMYLVQVQNPGGLVSNDALIYNDLAPVPPRHGNLIASGGTFDDWDASWNTVQLLGSVRHFNGLLQFDIRSTHATDHWRVQLSHRVWLVGGQEYTLCYDARTVAGARPIRAYLDKGAPNWERIIRNSANDPWWQVSLTSQWKTFSHTFSVEETDTAGRIAFDLAQNRRSVQFDNIGLYEGTACGSPGRYRQEASDA